MGNCSISSFGCKSEKEDGENVNKRNESTELNDAPTRSTNQINKPSYSKPLNSLSSLYDRVKGTFIDLNYESRDLLKDDIVLNKRMEPEIDLKRRTESEIELNRRIESADLIDLLGIIETNLDRIECEQLDEIYNRLNYFCFISPGKNIVEILSKSMATRSLLDRTTQQIDRLKTDTLLRALRVFCFIEFDSTDELLITFLEQICLKVNHFDLRNVENSLNTLTIYKQDRNYYSVLKFKLKKQRSTLLDPKNSNFTDSFTGESDDKFTYHESIDLLKTIRSAKFIQHRPSIEQLIEKCNSTIYEKLSSDFQLFLSNAIYYVNYLNKLKNVSAHHRNDRIIDSRILDLITPALVQDAYENTDTKYSALRMIHSLTELNIYAEQQLKTIYHWALNDSTFTSIERITIFNFLTELWLPFVDYGQLVTHLFKNDFDTTCSQFSLLYPIALCKLILIDKIDERLFDNFKKIIKKRLKLNSAESVDHRLADLLILSKQYLQLSGQLDNELKNKIKNSLDHWITIVRTYIESAPNNDANSDVYFSIDKRLQKDGRLSTGLYVGSFSIYDRSAHLLVPLTEHVDYFNKIDQIPLSADQQV